MDGRALDKFRSILNEMKTNLIAIPPARVGNECIRGDDGDVTHNHMTNRMATQLTARNSAHIRRIEAALKRISGGTYGYCTECEEPIDERRLESRPITTLCASCKEDEEKLQASFAGSRRRTA